MAEVYICAAARTPIGCINGSLSSVAGHELGSVVIRSVLERAVAVAGGVPPTAVDEVVMGQALQAGQGQNPARQASMGAGLPPQVPATTVNMLCGSGLKAVALAYHTIRCGDSRLIVAGGQESMSKAPHVVHIRNGVKFGDASLTDSMLSDGLVDAFHSCHMGITAETVADRFGVSRLEQDQFALTSQQRVETAQKEKWFEVEIAPVTVTTRKGSNVVSEDEFPRAGCTLDSVSKVRAAFIKDGTGTVTAANASGVNDGAAAVLVASSEAVSQHGLQPLVWIVSCSQAGVEPMIMGTAPIPAIKKAVEKAGWNIDGVDLFEVNEAFAAASVAVMNELKLDAKKVNVSGGAIALGHPIGASGARVLVTLIYNMRRLGARRGVAALCVGGGMGVAMCLELCE